MTDASTDAPSDGDPHPTTELGALQRAPDRVLRLLTRIPAGAIREVVAVYRRIHSGRLVGVSSEVAFWFALATVPTILAVLTVAGAFESIAAGGTEIDIRGQLERLTRLTFAGTAEDGVLGVIDALFDSDRPGLFSFSIISVVFLASRGFLGLNRGLRVMYGTVGSRPWWHERLAAIGFTLAGIVMFALAMTVFVVGPLLGRGIAVAGSVGLANEIAGFWRLARWIVIPSGLVLFLASIYHYARGGHGRWFRDLPGALLATLLLALAVAGYRVYLVASPSDVFGAATAVLGGAFATLVLLALVAASLLVGGAFNAEHDPDIPEVDDLTADPVL